MRKIIIFLFAVMTITLLPSAAEAKIYDRRSICESAYKREFYQTTVKYVFRNLTDEPRFYYFKVETGALLVMDDQMQLTPWTWRDRVRVPANTRHVIYTFPIFTDSTITITRDGIVRRHRVKKYLCGTDWPTEVSLP